MSMDPQRQLTLMPIVKSGPKSKLVRDFMPVLVIYKFDEDSIKSPDNIFPISLIWETKGQVTRM